MSSVMLYAAILCAAPITKNKSRYAWNGEDNDAYRNAKHVCRTDPQMSGYPCVKSFTKLYIRHYDIVCGRAKNEKR